MTQLPDRDHEMLERIAAAQDADTMNFASGTEVALQDTYCTRMLNGTLPNVVPDTSKEPAVGDLGATLLVGSYVGVPTTLADGSVHGTLCAVSSEPREHLGDAELAFMRVLAGMVANRIDSSHGSRP